MTVHDVAQWHRCQELAKRYGVDINISSAFELTDKRGNMLGVFETVSDVFHFLCGYSYSVEKDQLAPGDREAGRECRMASCGPVGGDTTYNKNGV